MDYVEKAKEILDKVEDKEVLDKITSYAYERGREIYDEAKKNIEKFLKTSEGKALLKEASSVYKYREVVIPVKDLSVVLKMNVNITDEFVFSGESQNQKLVLSSGERVSLSKASYERNVLSLFTKDTIYIQAKKEINDDFEKLLQMVKEIADKNNLEWRSLWYEVSVKADKATEEE